MFTAVGANAAITHGYTQPFLIVAMGLVTGIGGGIFRDVFAKEIPFVFRKEIYGVASIIGAISLILSYSYLPIILSLYLCLIITFTIRVLAFRFQVHIPIVKVAADKQKQTLDV